MSNVFKPSFREFLWGDIILGGVKKNFKYSIVSENEKQWNKPIRNLISNQDNMVVRTSWDLPFKTNQQVNLDGSLYLIVRCGRLITEVNEQSMRMWKCDDSAYWVLEVTR